MRTAPIIVDTEELEIRIVEMWFDEHMDTAQIARAISWPEHKVDRFIARMMDEIWQDGCA